MATQRQDVELGVGVNVTNAERIDSLTNDLKELAQQGKLSAGDFERLSKELDKIGAQSDVVQSLGKVEAELKQTSDSLAQATVRAEELGATLTQQRATTEAFREAQQRVASELRTTQTNLIAAKERFAELSATTDRAAKGTADYQQKARALKSDIAELTATAARQRLELQDANKALGEAEAALSKLETSNKRAASSVDSLTKKVASQSQELTEVKTALSGLGLASESAANAEESLAQALDEVTTQSAKARVEFERLSAIEKAVAASNERNVELARKAATERAAAAQAARQAAQEQALAENRLAYALQEVQSAEAAAAAAAKQAADAIQQSFGVVGVRSAQAIQAEINQVRDAMGLLRQSGALTGKALADAAATAAARVSELEFQLRAVNNQATFTDRLRSGFTSLADGANALIGRFGALGASIGAVVFAFKPFFDTIIQFDSMRRALTAVTGSVTEAERAIKFLRETANASGLAIGDISDAYVRFVASAKSSGIAMDTVRSVFFATAQAAGNLGLSSDKLSHILDALAQMANKGVVSMEELRQQLGDSLPGALGLLAKGLGITEQQLVKLVESGQLLTVDALPALAQALTTLGAKDGQVTGIAAAFNQLKNSIVETTQIAADSQGFNLLLETLKVIGIVVASLYTGFLQLVEGIGMLVSSVVGAGKALLTFSTGPLKQAGAEINASADRVLLLQQNFSKLVNGLYKTGTTAKQTAETVAQSAQKVETSTAAYNSNAQAQTAAATAAQTNAQAQTATGDATSEAASQAQDSIGKWYALQIAFKDLNTVREQEIVNAEILAKAAKLEGDTRKQLAQIAGDQSASVKIVAEASELEASKLKTVSDLRRSEVEQLTQQRDQLAALARELGDPGGNRAKEIEKIERTIAARQAESEKAYQQAEAARLAALANTTAAQTYADNAAKVDVLRQAYVNSEVAVKALEQAQRAGMATQAQVDAARERAATAEALYRDSVNDSAAAVQRKTKALEGDFALSRANAELAKARIDSEIAVQSALGDTARVTELGIEKKKIDLQTSRERIAVTQQEIELERKQIELDAAKIKQNDPLREQQEAEIALRRQALQIKEVELQRDKELSAQKQRSIELEQQRGAASINASSNAVAALEREMSEREKANALLEKSIELENKRLNRDAQGFSLDKTGKQTVNAEMPTYMSILGQLKGYGLSDSEASGIAREFTDSNGNVQFFNNPGQIKYGGNGGSISYAVQQAASKLLYNRTTYGSAPTRKGNAAAETTSSAAQTTTAAPASSVYTVKIELGSQSTSINTVSDADARRLIELLTSLQSRTTT